MAEKPAPRKTVTKVMFHSHSILFKIMRQTCTLHSKNGFEGRSYHWTKYHELSSSTKAILAGGW